MPTDMNNSRFLLRGFRRPREIACFALGKLERQVLEEIWRLGEVTVRDVYRALREVMWQFVVENSSRSDFPSNFS